VNRRGFLGTILAAACAPAIVRADSLMRSIPRETTVYTGMDFARDDDCCTIVQWVDGQVLHSQEFRGSADFVAPKGVNEVWLTMYGGGGGGWSRRRRG